MDSNNEQAELRHATELARSHRFSLSPLSEPVKFVGYLEEAVEKAFDAAMASEHSAEEVQLQRAQQRFHAEFEKMIKAQIKDMKSNRPLEELEEATENFLRSVDNIRNILPSDAVPNPMIVRDQTRMMLQTMEAGLRYSDALTEQKLERLKTAGAKKLPAWQELLRQVHPAPEQKKALPADPILDIGRRQAAHAILANFKMGTDLSSAWFDHVLQANGAVQAHLRREGKVEHAGNLAGQVFLLEKRMGVFAGVAARNASEPNEQGLRRAYHDIASTVETIRGMMPAELQERIPTASQFAHREDRVLDQVQRAVANIHPRVNPNKGDERGRAS